MTIAWVRADWIIRSALIAMLAASTCAFADDPPTGCTDISQIPVVNSIEYGAGIQDIFVQFSSVPKAGCADCHTSMDNTMTPAGELNLDPTDPAGQSPYANIVGVPSARYPTLDYVVPNHPEKSLLFMKINCDNPPLGSRMPLGYLDVFTTEQQALIYDWIAEGATVEPTNSIFRGTFDIRGLFIDAVFANGFESH